MILCLFWGDNFIEPQTCPKAGKKLHKAVILLYLLLVLAVQSIYFLHDYRTRNAYTDYSLCKKFWKRRNTIIISNSKRVG
jgi:hypothetical protein